MTTPKDGLLTRAARNAARKAVCPLAIVTTFAASCQPRPASEPPITFQVTATLTAASAEEMANTVTTPMERALSKIGGVQTITSSSRAGETAIVIRFDPKRGSDAAAHDVQVALMAVVGQLPAGTSGPNFLRGDPDDPPVLYLALTSDRLPLSALTRFARSDIAPQVSTVSYVGRVSVYGPKDAIRVALDPGKLAAYGIGIEQVKAAVRINRPIAGRLTVEILNNVVAHRNGASIRVGDVATVMDGVENENTHAWFNGKPAVIVAVQRVPGADGAKVAADVRQLLPRFRSVAPATLNIEVVDPADVLASLQFAGGASPAREADCQMQIGASLMGANVESIISILDSGEGQIALRLRPHQQIAKPPNLPCGGVHLRKVGIAWQQVVVKNASLTQLAVDAQRMKQEIRSRPSVLDVVSDLGPSVPRLSARIDAAKAKAAGMSESAIREALAVALDEYRVPGEPPIILEAASPYKGKPEAISALGLDRFVALTTTMSPTVIHHTDLVPSVTISYEQK